MTTITDDFMKEMLTKSKNYTIAILKAGPNRHHPELQKIVWEHARRNFQLRAEGLLPVVFPIRDGSDYNGIGIFNANEEETIKIMEGDPGVIEGIFTYEIHPTRSFPGDALPE